ncbi:DUF3182 family protein [Piscinibacter sp. XHJ-5]|uniref:DUF3182 family protein n=1 Tax=Piscinibacter sp. XHJ-5 TaxID=3037797 RepID=UPI002453238B|nr:DUF3182 family protein [Piscinibacter sp. XHJ-5]
MAALTPHRHVCFVACRRDARDHELATQRGVAERLATLLGCRYAGDADPAATGPIGYAVPNDTLVSLEQAQRLGIRGRLDLFGGVVPLPFIATKVITHGLLHPDAPAPAGWRREFAERVANAVLPGYSAFSLDDAQAAGRRLLEEGPVRLKAAMGTGGAGQSIARTPQQLDEQLASLDQAALQAHGVVLERNLSEVRTYSIGLLHVGSLVASYFGSQHNTLNRHGEEVYGGSELTVVRGGFDALERAAAGDADLRWAIALARSYHAAALECYAGMYASRANYDVVRGHDAQGRALAGVLESSWRIGGASGAEVAALQALVDDASLESVNASTTEVHGPQAVVPPGATLYFQGDDPHVGPITKYAQVHPHGHARRED